MLFATKPVEQKEPWKELDAETLKILELIANDKLSEGLTAINNVEKKNMEIPFYDCLRAAIFYKITEEYKNKEFGLKEREMSLKEKEMENKKVPSVDEIASKLSKYKS